MRSWLLIVAALTSACRGSERAAPANQPPPRRAAAVVPVVDAMSIDATPLDATPGTNDISLTVDGSQFAMRWGFVAYYEGGARLVLFSEPVDCTMVERANALPGARVLVKLPAGPGGRFFVGHPVGLDATVLSPETRIIPAWTSIVTLEPSTWKRGARVRGTIDGHHMNTIGSASLAGHFDVEICEDVDDTAESRVAASAPARPAQGAIGKERISPRTTIALVLRSPATSEEVTLVATDRGHGSRRHLWIGFFSAANVPCPTTDDWDPAHLPQLYLQYPGGAGAEQPLVGTQQPADAVFPNPNGDLGFRAVWRGWVQYDDLAFDHGAKIRGTLWEQAPYFEDKRGTFGGRFEATVCDPYR